MKWELVVTDTKAGKTGRVRIEAPDQATAERIAGEKGWVVDSVRLFETPGIYPPGHPAGLRSSPATQTSATPQAPSPSSRENTEEAQESASDEERYDSAAQEASAQAAESEEEDAYTAAARTIDPLSGMAAAREVARPAEVETPAPVATTAPTLIPPKMPKSGAAPASVAPASQTASSAPGRGPKYALCALLGLIFWVVGLGLIGWGITQLAFFVGYAPVESFSDGTAAGIAANRLTEIKMLMRGLVGGVFVGSGLLAALLGTLLARRNHKA